VIDSLSHPIIEKRVRGLGQFWILNLELLSAFPPLPTVLPQPLAANTQPLEWLSFTILLG
jgi:hypothetical protein